MEIGIRAESLVENPHSKGLNLLRSLKVFIENEKDKSATTRAKIAATAKK